MKHVLFAVIQINRKVRVYIGKEDEGITHPIFKFGKIMSYLLYLFVQKYIPTYDGRYSMI